MPCLRGFVSLSDILTYKHISPYRNLCVCLSRQDSGIAVFYSGADSLMPTHCGEGLGLALFRRRGMTAWIQAWPKCNGLAPWGPFVYTISTAYSALTSWRIQQASRRSAGREGTQMTLNRARFIAAFAVV